MAKIEDKFKGKSVPKELAHFDLQLVSDNGSKVYHYAHITITEKMTALAEYYPLSMKEIMNIIAYYGAFNRIGEILVIHQKLVNLQAFQAPKLAGGKDRLVLYSPSTEMVKGRKVPSERYCALSTVLHELGHILGYMPKNESERRETEAKADAFAEHEIDKFWKKLIKE